MSIRELVTAAELSDQFFNSPEAEAVQNYHDGSGELLAAAEAFKRREFHPWSAEHLCRDFLRRV